MLAWLGATTLAALAALPAATAMPAASAAAVTPGNGARFADAVAEASIVYVQTSWRGWMVVPHDVTVSKSTGEYVPQGYYGPYKGTTTCSGFVASSSGDIVTAGHCVDSDSVDFGGKGVVLAQAMADFTHPNGKPWSASAQAANAEILREVVDVEGEDSGSPPDRTVQVTVPSLSQRPQPANVVDVQPFTQGDVALLQATGVRVPLLPVAHGEAENGQRIIAAGYPGSVAGTVDSSAAPSFREGSISGTQTVNGTPFTEVSSATSPGMSGGPVLDLSGRVVGTVSWAPTADPSSADFIADAGSVRSLLSGNGVQNTLGTGDRAFRQGLAYYFAREYHNAVDQFDRAKALRPGLELITEFRRKAVARYPFDVAPPSSGPPWWALGAGVAVVVLALGAGLTTWLLVRRHGHKQAATVPAGQPVVPHQPQPGRPTAGTAQAPPAGSTVAGFCPSCGTPHAGDARFCASCGQSLQAAPQHTERGEP